MKKKLIILSLSLDQSKWKMMEFDKIYQKYDIEIHQLINVIYPGSNLNFGKSPKKIKLINFENLKKLKNYFEKKIFSSKKKKEKIIVLDIISLYDNIGPSLNAFLVNLYLKKRSVYVIKFQSPGLPDFKTNSKNNFNNNLIILFTKPLYSFGILKMLFFSLIIKLMKIYPKHLFFSGKKNKIILKNKKIKNMKLTEISSWEYSKFIERRKMLKINNSKKRYAVYLADRAFNLKTENQIFDKKGNQYLSYRHWQIPLNNFFKYLEILFNLKIVIAAHPKTNMRIDNKNYYPRKVYSHQTLKLLKSAKFAITTHSTSLCYAVAFKKPIIFINSQEIENQKNLNTHIESLSDYFNSTPVNINNKFKKKEILRFNRFNLNRNKNFKIEFLSSLYKEKQNYKIILEEIKDI